ncbi:MAG TPA: IS1595 family transposase [Chthonomonadaceae bacterium]|nr:IS1595 family transposase [Chthonomonadaceae bacterium]
MEQPQTLQQAIKYFSDPEVCFEYAKNLNWPNGVECPYCRNKELSFISTQQVWNCRPCGKRFSVRVGTIFESSRLPLETWFAAMWLIANAKNGISSCEIARSLGVTQKTAWFLLHRIRYIMETGSIAKMEGTVEVDETVIGAKAKTMHADKRQEKREQGFPKSIVFGLKERGGNVQTMIIGDASKETLHGIINYVVEEGSTVCTDSWKSYQGLSERYEHGIVDHKKGQYTSGDNGEYSTNGMENYWSILDRCYHGTYVQLSGWHLHRYLAEEDFRYNSRTEKDGDRFRRVASQIVGKRLTYDQLTTGHLQHIAPK